MRRLTYRGVPAVVVGLDSLQGLQSARILNERGVPVIGIAKSAAHHATKTRACRDVVIADTTGEDLVMALQDLGRGLDSRAVLFPCQDKNVITVSEHRERLEEWYEIVLPPHDTVELLMDKAAFYKYCEVEGLPIPLTYFVHSDQEAEIVAGEIDYPCILKPPFRLRRWSGFTKQKAFVASDRETFLNTYERCRGWADVLIAQKLIPGDDTHHYTCNCYFGRDGRLLASFTSRKIRQWPPRTGQACLSEEARNEVVAEATEKLYGALDHRGLGYVEMKQDAETGEHFIIEPNVGRPTGRAALAEAAGVELLYTMYCDAAGLPLPDDRHQTYRGVKWIHLIRDLQASLHYWRGGELTAEAWWRSMRGEKAFAILSLRDPLPFLFAILGALRGMFGDDRRDSLDEV